MRLVVTFLYYLFVFVATLQPTCVPRLLVLELLMSSLDQCAKDGRATDMQLVVARAFAGRLQVIVQV